MARIREIMAEQVVALPPSATLPGCGWRHASVNVGTVVVTDWKDRCKLCGIASLGALAAGSPNRQPPKNLRVEANPEHGAPT